MGCTVVKKVTGDILGGGLVGMLLLLLLLLRAAEDLFLFTPRVYLDGPGVGGRGGR